MDFSCLFKLYFWKGLIMQEDEASEGNMDIQEKYLIHAVIGLTPP